MALREGDVLQQRYCIRRALKAGGMGAVFLAHDSHLDGLCAVKEMHPSDDDWALRRFREEATLLSRLQHPHIPKVRDYFVVEGSGQALYYIVMDYIAGKTLAQEMEQGGLSGEQAREDALALLGVLEYLHGLEPPILHRDIKPANLIRQESDGRLFLVDFGLARTASEHTQTTAGTLAFCPPEQLFGKAEPRSDLYSLAATLYVALTGEMFQMGKCKPILLFRPELEVGLAQVIDRALHLDPDQRFASATAMKEALLSPVEVAPPVRRSLWPVALLAGLGLALGVGWKGRVTSVAASPTPSVSPTPLAAELAGAKVTSMPEAMAWVRRLKVKPEELEQASLEVWNEVDNLARVQGVNGIPVRYFHGSDFAKDPLDCEVGLILPESAPPPEGWRGFRIDGPRVARWTVTGPHEGVPAARLQLRDWLVAQGYQPGPDCFEIYRIATPLQPDEKKWETDLYWPVSNKKSSR